MKKLLVFFLVFAGFTLPCMAQEKFSKEVQDITEKIFSQVTKQSIMAKLGADSSNYKIAIVLIENEAKKVSTLTELLENKIAINLAMNSNGKYDVLDRNYIDKLIKEKNITIDYDNKRDYAKNLGRIKAANLIIVGTLTSFENDFELNIQILETKEGSLVGGATGNITSTQLLKEKNQTPQNQFTFPVNSQSIPNPVTTTVIPISNDKGSVSIQNITWNPMKVILSKDPIEPGIAKMSEKVWIVTVASDVTEVLNDLPIGLYYVCGLNPQLDTECKYTKRISIRTNEVYKIIIK